MAALEAPIRIRLFAPSARIEGPDVVPGANVRGGGDGGRRLDGRSAAHVYAYDPAGGYGSGDAEFRLVLTNECVKALMALWRPQAAADQECLGWVAEGLALHLQGDMYEGLDLHAMAAALVRAKCVAPLRETLARPFTGSYGSAGSEAAGRWWFAHVVPFASFTRWLVDRRGVEPYRAVYRGIADADPGAAWAAGYGTSLERLDADWRRFLAHDIGDPARLSEDERRELQEIVTKVQEWIKGERK